MSCKQYSVTKRLVAATALALGASSVALADDSSMSRFGGESYAYFNRPTQSRIAATPDWRKSHPNGLTERELQALSSNDLSVFATQLNPPVFARAPADPTWRQSHPNGLTERELQALSASSLASWQEPNRASGMTNVAQSGGKQALSAHVIEFFDSGRRARTGTDE